MPVRDKHTILSVLITGDDTHLRAELLRRYCDAHAPEASTRTTPPTAGELLAAAGELGAERERRDTQERERDRVRRELSAAAARQRHLDTLAVDQPAAWQRIDELIATKKPREYDTAVQLLVDLRDLAERDGATATFRQRLAELHAAHAQAQPAGTPRACRPQCLSRKMILCFWRLRNRLLSWPRPAVSS